MFTTVNRYRTIPTARRSPPRVTKAMNERGWFHKRLSAWTTRPRTMNSPDKRSFDEWDWLEFALLHRLPVLDVVKVFHVVNRVMAPGRQAGELVAFDVGHGLRIGRVQGALLKAARAFMAV